LSKVEKKAKFIRKGFGGEETSPAEARDENCVAKALGGRAQQGEVLEKRDPQAWRKRGRGPAKKKKPNQGEAAKAEKKGTMKKKRYGRCSRSKGVAFNWR